MDIRMKWPVLYGAGRRVFKGLMGESNFSKGDFMLLTP